MSIRSFFKAQPKELEETNLTETVSRKRGKSASTDDNAEDHSPKKANTKKETDGAKSPKKEDTGAGRKLRSPKKEPAGKSGKSGGKEKSDEDEKKSKESTEAGSNETAMSPEVLEKIRKNKEEALERKKANASKGPPVGAKTLREAAEALPESWKEALSAEFSKEYFKKLDEFVTGEIAAGKEVFPPLHEVFTAFHLCPLDKVSVVVVGQDPYHGPGQAHGLSFSVKPGVTAPPSLVNMYKELESDPGVPGFKRPSHGCLARWAEQGVFMLNAVLTVRRAEPNSHQKRGWETFTDAVVSAMARQREGLVFLLWGRPAQDKCKTVDAKRHKVLKAAHPSPLSASKGFFGCKHFSLVNEHLTKSGQPPIDWQI